LGFRHPGLHQPAKLALGPGRRGPQQPERARRATTPATSGYFINVRWWNLAFKVHDGA